MKRTHALLDGEAASTATTKEIDVRVSDPISAIDVQMKGLNNGSVPTAHPAAMVSKIELIDGSDVLASVSGYQAQAAGLLMNPDPFYNELNFVDETYAIANFRLNFGRMLWDKQFALDPKKFDSLQLRITHNKASGGSAPDAGVLSVFAHLFDGENLAPQGFLSLKEVRAYLLVSSAQEEVLLPRDQIIRRLILRSLYTGKQPWEQFNRIKLSIDEDKRVILNNMRTSDLLKILPHNPSFTERLMVYDVDAETTAYITPTYDVSLAGNGVDASEVTLLFEQSYGGTVAITAGAAGTVGALVRGKAPHGALNITMGDPSDPMDWLDVRNAEKLAAVITAGSSVGSANCEVLAETLRKY